MIVAFIDLLSPLTFIQVALILFFSVFVSVLVREALRPKHEVTQMSHMPLDTTGESPDNANQGVNP